MRKALAFLFTVLLVVATATSAMAQGIDGTLRGDVKDESGAAVPGTPVTVTNEQTALSRTMESSSVGTFNFPNLLVGVYTITALAPNFQKYVRTGIEVKTNQVTEVSVALRIGAARTTVEVSAGAEMLHTTTSQLGTSWNSRQVAEIPVPSVTRDPQNLALFQVGTTSQSGGVAGTGGSIGGNRPRDNNFVVDGIDNNRLDITGISQTIIPDAVAEFTLLTNQFSAEYGHSTAGQFIQTTKSGTNQWHGSASEYLNNRRLNSADNLTDATMKPNFDRNRAAGTLGAPIKKDKLFIFGSYQYLLDNEASVAGSASLAPTAAGFATLNSLASNPASGVSPTAVGLLSTYIPPAAASSTSKNVVNLATGLPVAIPVGPESPAAPSFLHQHDFQINTDYNTDRHRISGRVAYDRQRQPNVGAFPVPAFTGFQAVDARSLTAADVFSISPRLVNEFRAGYRRFVLALTVPDLPHPGGMDVFPNFNIIELAGLQLGPNGNGPQANTINSYQVTDTLSYVRGRHALKGGIDYRWYIAPSGFLPRARGQYNYTGLDQFVKDSVPDNLARRGVGDASFAGNEKAIYWFFQDDLKVGPRLTLNLGLRYEYATNPRDDQKQLLNATANLPSPSTPGLAPLIFGVPKTDKDDWAPRFGFAWDVFGDHKTSIRGGVARAYDVIFQNLPLLELPPQLQQEIAAELAIFGTSAPCTSAAPPAWCASGTGFIKGGAIPGVFVPKQLTVAQARRGTQGLIVDTESPDTYTWSLGIERELGKDWAVEARYVGTRGLRLPAQIRLNPLTVPPASLFLPTYLSASQVPTNVPATAPNLAAFLAAPAPLYAADGFTNGSITAFPAVGSSIYHGGSIELTRRMSGLGRWGNGLFLRSGYTWSKAIDNSTNELFTSQVNPRRPEDFSNIRSERGLSAIDHKNKFTITAIYELPRYTGSTGFIKGLLNQWQVSSSYIAETGQPVTALSFIDANGNGDSAGDRAILNPSGVGLTTTDVNAVCRNAITGATSSVAPGSCAAAVTVGYVAINPTAQFVRARPGARTNTGRDNLISAGINNWNLAFVKNTRITESKSIQFRMEMINAFNHAQPILGLGNIGGFSSNNTNAINGTGLVAVGDNPSFMKPADNFSTGNGLAPFQRVITFGLKLNF